MFNDCGTEDSVRVELLFESKEIGSNPYVLRQFSIGVGEVLVEGCVHLSWVHDGRE